MINVTNVVVLQNPAPFLAPFQFEISFECTGPLKDDLEWKIIYVGSAESEKYDQELESILVGPIPVGINKFIFEANPPNPRLIPEKDLIGVTVILITCSYRGKEFIRVGYYVNNEYETQELRDNPPEIPDVTKLYRNILAEKPRVTRFPIEWDTPVLEQAQQPASLVETGMGMGVGVGVGGGMSTGMEFGMHVDSSLSHESMQLS